MVCVVKIKVLKSSSEEESIMWGRGVVGGDKNT